MEDPLLLMEDYKSLGSSVGGERYQLKDNKLEWRGKSSDMVADSSGIGITEDELALLASLSKEEKRALLKQIERGDDDGEREGSKKGKKHKSEKKKKHKSEKKGKRERRDRDRGDKRGREEDSHSDSGSNSSSDERRSKKRRKDESR